jgi:hypothetical protein
MHQKAQAKQQSQQAQAQAQAQATLAPRAYIPPNKRQNPTASPRTEKKELKKEFHANNPSLFPTLGETITKHCISFSSAAAKKIEEPIAAVKSSLTPGWVYIRKHNGAIQYKYGAPCPSTNFTEEEDKFTADALYKCRLERQQFDQDMDVMRLGDLSDYYNEPTIVEIQEEYERDAQFWEDKMYSDESDQD